MMVDMKDLFHILIIYGAGGSLLEGSQSFNNDASASVHMNRKFSERLHVSVDVRHGSVVSLWLLKYL